MRKEAAQALGTVLGENVRTFALITNTLAKDKEIEDQWRGFERPISARNLGNRVEDEVVDALIAAVEASAPRLAHRYYALKARWMGGDRLDYWDRTAPLPEDDDRLIGLGRGGGRPCSRPTAPSRPSLPPSVGASSRMTGSTHRCATASRQAPSPIPRCRARTPTCCSTTRARRAT